MLRFTQLRTASLFFAVFFALVAVAQYFFVRTQTEQVFIHGLLEDAQDLNRWIAYDNGVNLATYAKAPIQAASFAVILNDGTILEVEFPKEGIPRGLLPPVAMPLLDDAAFAGPVGKTYVGGAKQPEVWTILAKHLQGGTVVLAITELDEIQDPPKVLRLNMDTLGDTLADVNRLGSKSLSNAVSSWALIADDKTLVNGQGRIPLVTDAMEVGRRAQQTGYQHLGDSSYYVLYSPITDKNITDKTRNEVGTAILTYEVKDVESAMANLLRFNVGVAAVSFTVFLILSFVFYQRHEHEKQAIREAFQNYFSPAILEAILKEPERLKLGGQRREVTVLFSDIRSFTALTERLPPQQLTKLLQEYFGEMTDAVFATEGIVDKYIGDAIMAFWGAPIEQEDQADRAVKTAIDMTKRLQRLQTKWAAEGMPLVDIGIGINLGIVTVGNFGSARRFDYTVIGDAVNTASRLESLNKKYESHIIISESTKLQLTAAVQTRDLGEVEVRGKEHPIRIFEVLPS